MVVQSELGEGSAIPTDPHHTPSILQSSSSQPQKTHKPRKPTRKVTQVPYLSDPIEHVTYEAIHKELGDSLVESLDDEESLGEDASKQGIIKDIDTDEYITLVNVQDDAEMFDVDDLSGEEVFVAEQEVVKDEQEEPGKSTTTTATISKQQSQDKGKGIMIEEPVKPKKKYQIRLDEEAAKRLQAEFNENKDLQERELKKNKKPILP
nr:hypothetical protein [Tanacetum cinerariifolium]